MPAACTASSLTQTTASLLTRNCKQVPADLLRVRRAYVANPARSARRLSIAASSSSHEGLERYGHLSPQRSALTATSCTLSDVTACRATLMVVLCDSRWWERAKCSVCVSRCRIAAQSSHCCVPKAAVRPTSGLICPMLPLVVAAVKHRGYKVYTRNAQSFWVSGCLATASAPGLTQTGTASRSGHG